MRGSFRMVQLSGKPAENPGEKRKHCKASVKDLEARRWECLFSFWLAGRVDGGRRDSPEVVWFLMDRYDVPVIDIYSCDRP